MSMGQGYDFNALYGMADHSTITPLEPGSYDAIVETAEFGRTKDGTKGAWTIKFRVTTGERANYPVTMTMSINPTKSDGSPNPQGLGIMFRQLAAMGVPVPPEQQPFWALGWTEANVADYIKGRPVLLRVVNDPYEGQDRSKVRDIKPPRPGAPLEVQQVQQQQPQQPPVMPGQGYQPQGYAPQGAGGGYGPPAQQGYNGGNGAPNPAYGGGGGGYQGNGGQQFAGGAYGQPGGNGGQQQQVPGPWQNAQQGPTQPAYGGQPQNQAPGYGSAPPAPAGGQNPYGPPAQPQFAPGGQGAPGAFGAQSPAGPYGQPNADWNPAAPQNQAPPAQFQPPAPQNGGQPPQGPQQPQGAPELPPWAQ